MMPRAAALTFALALTCGGCHTHTVPPSATDDMNTPVADLAHRPLDLAEPDMARPLGGDLIMSDLIMSDLAISDLTSIDLATPDLTLPVDLSTPDLRPPADLAMSAMDLALPDLAKPIDLAGADLACAMACNSPPPSRCQANNIITYPQNGTCQNGNCAYAPTSSTCMYGCYQSTCTMAMTFAGNTAAFTSMGGQQIMIGPNNPGPAPSNDSVSVTIQTYPHGSASDVHLIWATDANYTKQTDVLMSFDKEVGNNDQWYGIIPAQQAGTQIYFYVRSDGYNVQPFYSPGGFGNNWTYKTQ